MIQPSRGSHENFDQNSINLYKVTQDLAEGTIQMRKYVILMCLLWPALAFAEAPMRQITVTGTGVISAAPDMALVRLGVTREARTASQAMSAASEAVAAVLESIAQAGIAPKDVQTASLGLSPVWDRGNTNPPRVRGYMASNNLTVRVRDLDGLGALLDVVISDGANALNGLSFSLAEPGPMQTEARASAVRDARSKAETLAKAAEVTLGPVLTINEGGGSIAPAPMMRGAMMEASAVPIAEGEVDVRVTVSVAYGIGSE